MAFGRLPDGRTLLATGSDDETVRLWDPATGQPVGDPLTGHTDRVTAVAFGRLPDGRTLLATGSDDGTVRLWDPATGHPVGDPLTGHTDRGVRRWRSAGCPTAAPCSPPAAATGRCGCGTRPPAPRSATRSPATPTAVTGGGVRPAARRPDPARHRQLRRHGAAVGPGHRQPVGDPLTGHTGAVTAVAFGQLPDGRTLLATGSDDGTVRLWDPATGHPVGDPLTGHTGAVTAVAFGRLPDGRTLLASGSGDGTVRLWDPATGQPGRRPAHRPHRRGDRRWRSAAARRPHPARHRQRRRDGAAVGPGHRPPRSATRSPATPAR